MFFEFLRRSMVDTFFGPVEILEGGQKACGFSTDLHVWLAFSMGVVLWNF